MWWQKLFRLTGVLFCLGISGISLLVLSGPTLAQNPEGLVVVIAAPVEGQQLFGPVAITGSAEHPSAFASYTLEYDDLSEPAQQWFLVQPRVAQQVRNDILGTWNTTMVPDGVYQLRLRVFLTDGQSGEYLVTNLRVINTQPTPVPTVAVGPAVEPAASPLTDLVPTSAIQQPPSNNPASAEIGLPGSASESLATPELSLLETGQAVTQSTRVNLRRVRSAFCSGVYLAFGCFGVMLIYLLVRGRLRPYTRRLVWQVRDEIDDSG